MDREAQEVARLWESNAEAWTRLSREGYDRARDLVIGPALYACLPDVAGLRGLDIGCGEGVDVRALARRGARMAGVDVAPTFIEHARAAERDDPVGATFEVASATDLPFEDAAFDFVFSNMCFHAVGDLDAALAEARRVLVPDGFLLFSIRHPCFTLPTMKWAFDRKGRPKAVSVAGYFEGPGVRDATWSFLAAPKALARKLGAFRTRTYVRTLATWWNALAAAGFCVEHAAEPHPEGATVEAHPELAPLAVVPFFLVARARKGSGPSA